MRNYFNGTSGLFACPLNISVNQPFLPSMLESNMDGNPSPGPPLCNDVPVKFSVTLNDSETLSYVKIFIILDRNTSTTCLQSVTTSRDDSSLSDSLQLARIQLFLYRNNTEVNRTMLCMYFVLCKLPVIKENY